MIWIILIPYCACAFALHGGQIITGIYHGLLNLICAIPFAVVFWHFSPWLGLGAGALAFAGVAIGHENFWLMGTGESEHREDNILDKIVRALGFKFGTLPYDIAGMAFKGLITLPVGGFIALPVAYYFGDRTAHKTSASEWLSGIFYGVILFFITAYGYK